MAPPDSTILITKLSALGAIFVVTVVFVYLPVHLFKKPGTGRWLDISNGFAAGVFLGAGLLHMLAESVEKLEAFKPILGGDYPVPYLLAAGGYILVLFLENFATIRSHTDEVCVTQTEEAPRPSSLKRSTSTACGPDVQTSVNGDSVIVPPDPEAGHDHPRLSHHHHHRSHVPDVSEGFVPYLVAIVLSVHAFLAGLALGSGLDFATALIVAVAILAHKWSEAFALGVSFVQGKLAKRALIIMAVIYSVMTPAGIGVGIATSLLVEADIAALLAGIFSCIAAGTFIYVAATELLPRVFEHTKDILLKFLFFSLGFAVMAVVKIWV